MVIGGIDLPARDGRFEVPAPGEKWYAKGGGMAEDLSSGLQLMELLRKQKFASQIAAIDMSNHSGRRDARSAWIVLETAWHSAAGTPHLVHWGRPIGQEKYYEVQSSAKIKTLKEVQTTFGRIDAGREYVDIRSEFARSPKAATHPPVPGTRG